MSKLLSILIIVFAFVFSAFAQINIVPKPKSVQLTRGLPFEFNYKTKIVAFDEGSRKLAGYLNDYLMQFHGFKLEYVESPKKTPKNAIVFDRLSANGNIPSDEAYGIYVVKDGVRIGARGDAGMFYGLQSLIQLLPAKIEKGKAKIPAVEILDQPRFKYRGMHLDVGRHFMPVEFVKKYIDLLSQYKLNTFHWHLTDDQGWRIEIKKYPKLTEIGSKRKESQLGPYTTTFRGDGIPIEGFYTQEQIKDVVAYAKARFINVIPEIELPGHASAALAAYPELGKGCKENYEYKVQQTWGIFKEVFCPTDATFKFLEDVLTETIALFPDSPYIHVGGDEVLKDHWKESAFVQDLMKREGLKDEHEVQSYFIRRMEKFINSKGKQIIGWDEILEGGLAPNAVVMSWRGEKGGIEAAKAKHNVIMTPTDYMYFDYGQGDPKFEPLNIGGFVPLEKVYSYNPIPKELTADEAKYVLGAQANIWTEYLKKPESVEYMMLPRMLALSEVNWSPLEAKNFADFKSRLPNQFVRLDAQKVNYRIPAPDGLQNILLTDSDKAKIELISPAPTAKIFYTLDGSDPTEKAAEYKGAFEIPLNQNEKKELKTIVMVPTGRKSSIYAATILRRPYLEAVNLETKKDGVTFAFYKNSFKSVGEMDSATPTETGETRSLGLQQFSKKTDLKEPFGVIYEGFVNVPNDGIYDFQLNADDGAVLQIDGETVVDNDGLHTAQIKSGVVPLRKGFHRFKLKYFQGSGDYNLNLRWGIKGQGLSGISGLVH
ncbi:MAG: family 20 glycosylhydrolase [Pyrinomonadaceae bacterium]|nr:family 20 glycosylhydrolase [Pyrinomonadaceae bacterium]